MKLTDRSKAIILMVLVAFFSALLSIVARLMDKGLGEMTQVYTRVLLGFLLGILVFSKKIKTAKLKKIPVKDWLILLAMGVLGYALGVFFITLAAIDPSTTLANLTVIFAMSPFFTYLYSIIFLKKKIRLDIILLLLFSFYGVVLVGTNSFFPTSITDFGIGEVYALVAGALFSVYYVGRKMLSDFLNNTEISLISMIIAVITSLILAFVRSEKIVLEEFLQFEVLIGLFLGGILNILVTLFQNYSFKIIDVVLGNQILLLQIIFSAIIGFLFYSERITWIELLGAVIITTTVFIGNFLLKKTPAERG